MRISANLMGVTLLGLASLSASGCGASDAMQSDTFDAAVEPPIDASPPPSDAQLPDSPELFPELWYSVDNRLIRIELDADGAVVALSQSGIEGLDVGHNSLTMLDDGSLMGARLSNTDNLTYFFHIAEPPRDGTDPEVQLLGVMPESLMLEGPGLWRARVEPGAFTHWAPNSLATTGHASTYSHETLSSWRWIPRTTVLETCSPPARVT